MGEFVGCDPVRVRQLADKLHALADTLAREGPFIRDAMTGWGSTMSFQLLAQQAAQFAGDATAMAKRADLARTIAEGGRYKNSCGVWQDLEWVAQLPWDPSDADRASEGARDASLLHLAVGDQQSIVAQGYTFDRQKIIADVAQSLAEHADDPAYLQAFFAAGGASAIARIPRELHGVDGTHDGRVLSDQSQRIIAQYATGLAAATRMAADGRIKLQPGAFDPIVHPPGDDMWSSAMLFKYGPKGDQWDGRFLADMGASVLDWRDHHQARPGYTPDSINAAGYAPGGWVDPDHAWYGSLGLQADYLHKGLEDAQRNVDAIRANDPALAVLERVSDNPDASRDLLTGPDGAHHARQLVDVHWATPGPFPQDDSYFPAKVIAVATTDRGPDHGQQSAQAALNVLRAASDAYGADKHRDGYDRQNYPTMPPDLLRGLTVVASAYVPDLARSTEESRTDVNAVVQNPATGTWDVQTNQAVINGALHWVLADPETGAAFTASVDAHIVDSTRREATLGTDLSPNELYQLGRLNGMAQVVQQDLGYDPAAQKDADNARMQTYVNAITGAAGNAPVSATPLGWAQAALGLVTPFIEDAWFPTDNAQQVESAAQRAYATDLSDMRIPVAQGLVDGHKATPPPGVSWYHDGTIDLRTPADRAAFDDWWGHLPKSETDFYNDVENGYDGPTTRRTPNDDGQGGR